MREPPYAPVTPAGVEATARQVRDGALRAEDLVRRHLDAVKARDPALRAFVTLDEEGSLAAARALDAKELPARRDLSLAGVAVAVKDSFTTRGLRTTCASRALERYVPPYDAAAVERLRSAGAIVLGKTNLDEFAMGSSTEHSAFGPTRNPWDPARVPGGSSGGSAVAVAAGYVSAAIGSDTGGSVRQPAALTGVVGYKPTYGRVSRYGLIAFASSLDCVGSFGRTVADVAALDRALAGHDPRDATSLKDPVFPVLRDDPAALRGVRLGVPREYFGPGVEPEVRAALASSIERLQAAGAVRVDLSMPHTEHAIATYYLLAPAEASSNLARYDGVRYGLRADARSLDGLYAATRDQAFGPEVKRRIMLGTFALSAGYFDAYYLRAQRARARLSADFTRAFAEVDLLVTPTSPTVAFPLGERAQDPLAMYQADLCTLPASLAGVPALSLPAGLGAHGLPVGMQLIAPAGGDARLLELAHAVERVLGPLG